MIINNHRITIREFADDVGVSIGSCHKLFSDVLDMTSVAAIFFLQLLNFQQKQGREVVQESLNDFNNDQND